MNKLRKRHLSTLHTARLLSNLILLFGFLFFPVVLGWFEYISITGKEPLGLGIHELAISLFSKTNWLISVAVVSMCMVWAGYILKCIVVLAETQLHDTAPGE